MTCLLLTAVLAHFCAGVASSAGPFNVTQQTYVAFDPARRGKHGHRVAATLYLPDSEEPAPVVAFAHGFNLGADQYPIAIELAARRGLVVLCPHNLGVFPSTENLAVDQAFLLAHAVEQATSNASSPFYGRVLDKTLIMGHSLGGGSTLLAADPAIAAGYRPPTAIATVSLGTYTLPNALKASHLIPANVPALLFTATQDCVDPPEKNSLPVFEAMESQCVAVVSVVGGTHCQYAAEDSACHKTEARCGAQPTITREVQLEKALTVLLPYLDAALGESSESQWAAFGAALDAAAAAGDVEVLARRTEGCARLPSPDLDAGFPEFVQRAVAGIAEDDESLSVTVLQANRFTFVTTKPTIEVSDAGISHVNVVTHVESTPPFSHSVAVKTESREQITGEPNNVTCAELHEASFNKALAALTSDERAAYGVQTKKLVFGTDKEYHTGLYVISAYLDIQETEDAVTVVAPRFVAKTGLPNNWGGKQYCRLLPPAAIYGWIRRQLESAKDASIVV